MKPLKAVWEELSQPLPPGWTAAAGIEPAMTPDELFELRCTLERSQFVHLAEGRANAVFSIREPRDPSVPRGFFQGTLLRVPKATPDVTPCDYEALQDFQEQYVDVFVGRQHIVPQVLVEISQTVANTLTAKRAAALRAKGAAKGDRSVIKAGLAMLVEDMGSAPGYKALEFKPKWLAQAPMAPADATRCRTCAREALRNAKLRDVEKNAPTTTTATTPICPLGLLHPNPDVVMSTVDRLAPRWTERERARLAAALRDSGVLERLRELQVEGDAGDALFAHPDDARFGLSMTLRDCSCFVRMPTSTSTGDDEKEVEDEDDRRPVVIKLADVDKKNWREKRGYWQRGHTELVAGGWYRGQESADPAVETACVLRLDLCLARGLDIPPPFRARVKA
ncbi:hypothetical protein GGR52DRAFT_531206 [Hypoxylon sp. FL1284]|nr:hypothetical protein GGR52DRAFT_531206 [Hypoxylon sp. FL1284]